MKLLHRVAAWFGRKAERSAVVEECEPRILYSADLNPALWTPDDPSGASAIVATVDPQQDLRTMPASQQEQQRRSREIVFVDAAMPDAQALIDGVLASRGDAAQVEVVQIAAGADGLRQIGEVLAGESGLDAIHIVSHGGPGRLQLGAATIDAAALRERADELGAWRASLGADADILLYGCDVAGNDEGLRLIDQLSRLTGADVAASIDATGHESLGGDWQLEAAVGRIDAGIAFSETFRSQWVGLLPTYQQFTNYTSTQEVKDSENWGQTFQHNSGNGTYTVNQLSLALQQASGAGSSDVLTVTLRDSWNGSVLASGTVTADKLGTSLGWVDFAFGDVVLNDNQSYTIRVSAVTPVGKLYVGENASGGYANGTKIDKTGTAVPGEDLAFKIAHGATLQAAGDTTIKLKAPDTTNNFGASTQLIIDRESTDLQRALLQFDLSSIPSNAIVNNATLKMQSTQIGGMLNINVYEMLQSWVEGTGNGTAGSANWNQSAPATNWTTAGGTYNPVAVATLNTNSTGQHTWSVTSLVQAWVAGSQVNNGLMVASPDGGGNRTVTYDSSEGTTAPVLVIDYTVPANTAPTLDATKSPVLSAIAEDAGAPVGAVGTLVSALVDFASPSGQVDNVTDADAGAQLGIAITAASTSNGSWWYSTDGGGSWSALGSPSDSSARLLAADSDNRLYFQPNANYNGTTANAITFRAWDRTSDTDGGTADTSGSNNGGVTAFSTATDTASLTVNAVNDALVITNLAGDNLAYSEGAGALVIEQGGNATVSDVDSTNFDTGTLTVSFVAGSDSAEDVLAIRNQGSGAGQIGVSGSNVTYDGTAIGTFTGGSGGSQPRHHLQQQRHTRRDAGARAQHHLPEHRHERPHHRRAHGALRAHRRRWGQQRQPRCHRHGQRGQRRAGGEHHRQHADLHRERRRHRNRRGARGQRCRQRQPRRGDRHAVGQLRQRAGRAGLHRSTGHHR